MSVSAPIQINGTSVSLDASDSHQPEPKRLQAPSIDFQPLSDQLEGELKWDSITRALYASSAAIVEIWPQAVLTPKNADDVSKALAFCFEQGVPVTCRGAGSGVVGQSLGEGLIIDFSVHMHRVLEVDTDAAWASCQPGVVKDDLDTLLATQGFFWPPDPSSSPWCTVGAMVANNSGGAKSVMYGTARDYLLELDCLDPQGRPYKVRPVEIAATGELIFAPDANELEKAHAQHAYALIKQHRETLQRYQPESTRCSSGYNLFQAIPLDQPLPGEPGFDAEATMRPSNLPWPERDAYGANRACSPWILDMPRIFCGSEGSLGVVIAARFGISKLPGGVAGAALSFESDEKMALGVVKLLRETKPAKLELLERSFIDVAAKAEPELAAGIPAKLKTQLIVEYFGDDDAACKAQVDHAIELMREAHEEHQEGLAFAARAAYDPTELEGLWKVRKVASPILSRVKGDVKPTRWVEDLAVPPWKLPQFIAGLMQIFQECGFPAALFGHAGEGNLHVNPRANVKDAEQRRLMRECAEKAFELTKNLGGVISGEHGDGTMRTPYLKRMFGEAYDLMVEIKRAWDPRWQLNPLTKVLKPGTGSERSITTNLRYGEDYTRHPTGAASLDRPEVLEEIEKCHGCGKCRVYCPLMSISKEEKYSARAKANLLRGVVSGKLDPDAFLLNEEFKDNLDLCINCAQCLVECPTQVDIPGIAMAFRENYVERKGGVGVVGEMLSKPDRIGRLGTLLPKLSNSMMSNRFARGIAQKAFGLDARRHLPEYRKETGLPAKRALEINEADRKALEIPGEVVLFPGCWAEYNDPDGEKIALVRILQALGIKVHLPKLNCCGISKITQGQMDAARKDWQENLDLLAPLAMQGAPILFSAPSCMLAAQHDMPRLIKSPAADSLASQMLDAHAFLRRIFSHESLRAQLQPLPAELRNLAYHQPCHSKVSKVGQEPIKLVELIPEASAENLDAGCCGLSGTFGLKTENFELSMKIGAKLFGKIEAKQPDAVFTPCGVCQTQIHQGAPDATILHPITLLYHALR